ncbi:hypothetical protein [Rhizobium sp. L1K21]|uniref:hypothetical protein n=1 Tax=Rhizobium sp. L1K21 TaxID=2954933 RepID=UPI002092B52B|nr:hypothetical protein [Rhizobium sp. L1K21]MCO6188441.1 hypothetical protein [Rhizobium sp. L1K21]
MQMTSIIARLDKSNLPLLIAYGEFDIPPVQDSVRQLVDALYARDGHLPLVEAVPGHTHISIVEHIGTVDEAFGENLAGFVELLALRAKQDAAPPCHPGLPSGPITQQPASTGEN